MDGAVSLDAKLRGGRQRDVQPGEKVYRLVEFGKREQKNEGGRKSWQKKGSSNATLALGATYYESIFEA